MALRNRVRRRTDNSGQAVRDYVAVRLDRLNRRGQLADVVCRRRDWIRGSSSEHNVLNSVELSVGSSESKLADNVCRIILRGAKRRASESYRPRESASSLQFGPHRSWCFFMAVPQPLAKPVSPPRTDRRKIGIPGQDTGGAKARGTIREQRDCFVSQNQQSTHDRGLNAKKLDEPRWKTIELVAPL